MSKSWSNEYSRKNISVYYGSSFNIKFPNFVKVSIINLNIFFSFPPSTDPLEVTIGLVFFKVWQKKSAS